MPQHPIAPVYDEHSRILILGSFPSVRSRETGFYYGHERNRFWAVLSGLLNEPLPTSIDEKKQMLLKHGIALWDVIGSCNIVGSSDAKITNAVVNDLHPILDTANIRCIFINGTQAYRLYEKYMQPLTGIPAVRLPSTSPANAAWSLDKLLGAWSVITDNLNTEE